MIVGLTGGIASGKSTVSNILKELEIKIIDADIIAKKISEKAEIKKEILLKFGEEILNSQKEIERRKLREIVFKNKEKLKILNSIYHPRIKDEFKKIKENHNKDDIIIFDVPLLFETDIDKECDKIILVCIDEEIQIDRLMKRDGIDSDLAKMIIKNQMPQEEKMKKADIILYNDGTLDELTRKTKMIIEDIIRRK
ncbi:dephospho-CoA kinase [Fusobacterium sp. IOR10]|uniref:dephospho-CoA kinase n=1 Tax=Fusobacterium sp. IOR10 TaxID=2665157 RepID=UPI0013D78DCF|nr:dephospho-CoA kinase [Fusobacterium sp. IOR10]